MRIGTLFSGIGAPELALKELGVKHTVEFACDSDPNAKATYLLNHRPRRLFDDVRAIDRLPPVDLLVFGFPCQAFSIAGLGKGLSDPRGQLVLEAIRLLRQAQPRWFVAENVANLVSLDGGKAFRLILQHMRAAGYAVTWAVLNSLDFGVPQLRRRVWIVGQRNDVCSPFSFPTAANGRASLTQVLDRLPRNGRFAPFFATEAFLAKPKVAAALAGYRHDYIRCLTGAIARNGSSGEYISYVAAVNLAIGQTRKPTPQECLRLHGFPEGFKFPQGLNTTARYNQAANTMTVPLVQAILKGLIAC